MRLSACLPKILYYLIRGVTHYEAPGKLQVENVKKMW